MKKANALNVAILHAIKSLVLSPEHFLKHSKLPLTKWLPAVYFITAHKKGISSYQLAKNIGTSQKTSWFMLHSIRKALEYNSKELLTGIVKLMKHICPANMVQNINT